MTAPVYFAADGAAQPIRPRGGAGTNSNAPAPALSPASCQPEPLPIASAPAPGDHAPARDSDHTAQADDISGANRVVGDTVNGGTATPAGSDIPGTNSAHAAPHEARLDVSPLTAPRAGDPARGAFFGGEWL